MEHPQHLHHPNIDFNGYTSQDNPGKLVLWGCFAKIGFLRGMNERYFLSELKKFLTSPQMNKITHFNFENNFYLLSINAERDFDLFIDMLAENNSITVLEIGNNYIPTKLMAKLAKILVEKSSLVELNVRMHWPGFMQSEQNIPFITYLAKELPRNLGLETLDLSGNHINKEGLIALADACERLEFLREVNLTNITYVNMTPNEVYYYWLRIQKAMSNHQDLLDAIMAMPDTPPPEKPKPVKRKLIEDSDDEQQTPPVKLVKSRTEQTFFTQKNQSTPALNSTMSKSFMARLKDIGIDTVTDNPLNLRLQHLIYFEQIESKLYRKFTEDPHVLFYSHNGHTYQHNYDGSYIKRWIKTNKWDPYSQREFEKFFIAPNPFMKKEIDNIIKNLEHEYQVRSTLRYT